MTPETHENWPSSESSSDHSERQRGGPEWPVHSVLAWGYLLGGWGSVSQTSQGEHGYGANRSYQDTASGGYGLGSALPGPVLGLPHLTTPSVPSDLLN